jgi:hypothetical protein
MVMGGEWTPQKAQRHHLPNNGTPSVANNPPTSIQIDYSFRHKPRQLKSTLRETFQMAQATSQ